jgi:hypothetical protein
VRITRIGTAAKEVASAWPTILPELEISRTDPFIGNDHTIYPQVNFLRVSKSDPLNGSRDGLENQLRSASWSRSYSTRPDFVEMCVKGRFKLSEQASRYLSRINSGNHTHRDRRYCIQHFRASDNELLKARNSKQPIV